MSPAVGTLDREHRGPFAPAREGQVWWAEVAHVRERIERRRAVERVRRRREPGRVVAEAAAAPSSGSRRTVTITGHAASVPAAAPVRVAAAEAWDAPWGGREQAWTGGVAVGGHGSADAPSARARGAGRRRPRRTAAEWLGARPDRIAAWAVALGFLLVLAALISAH
jgi:hypothetical protein